MSVGCQKGQGFPRRTTASGRRNAVDNDDDDDGYSRSSLKDVSHFPTAPFETFYGRTFLTSESVSDIFQLHGNNAMQIAGKAFVIHLLHLLQRVSSLARVTSVKWANYE